MNEENPASEDREYIRKACVFPCSPAQPPSWTPALYQALRHLLKCWQSISRSVLDIVLCGKAAWHTKTIKHALRLFSVQALVGNFLLQPWASFLASLSLSFLVCKMTPTFRVLTGFEIKDASCLARCRRFKNGSHSLIPAQNSSPGPHKSRI